MHCAVRSVQCAVCSVQCAVCRLGLAWKLESEPDVGLAGAWLGFKALEVFYKSECGRER